MYRTALSRFLRVVTLPLFVIAASLAVAAVVYLGTVGPSGGGGQAAPAVGGSSPPSGPAPSGPV